jgi:hypothetical protein
MTTKSWRDFLPIHPAAELFPRMREAELAALAEDIKANGLKSPIVLWSPESKNPLRYVLDGINRLDAMERAGIQFLTDKGEPTDCFGVFVTKHEKRPLTIGDSHRMKRGEHVEKQPDTDPYAYVVSANIRRRHLTAEQERDLIAKLIKATPDKSDRQIAETVKVDHKTVGAVRAEQEARGEIPHVETQTDSKGRQQPARRAPTKSIPPSAPVGMTWVQQVKLALGDATIEKIAGTCLDRADEYDELLKLNRGAEPGTLTPVVSHLVEAAAAGHNVSAFYPGDLPDDTGPASNGEIARKDERIEEPQADKRRLEIENVGLRSEVEEAKAAHKPEGKGEDSELGNLLRAWDRASQGAREKFKARVGLVAVQLPAKAMDDGLDIPECLRRAAP